MNVLFLGVNELGMDVYEWLCDREGVTVQALVTMPEQLSLVDHLEPELIVACGFPGIVPPDVLSVPERGCINVHPGLLPYTRGYNPNVWSIVEGSPAGVTIHYMDEGVDTGDIIATREVDTSFDDTGRTLYERMLTAGFELFTDTWPIIEAGEVEARSQDDDKATYHVQQDFVDLCEIDADKEYSAKELLDRLRALTFPPFNNAYVEVDGTKYYVEVDITPADEAVSGQELGHLSSYGE